MTHFPSEFDAEQFHPAEERTTSGLAIASLVCSLICCIPGLPLIGALLGLGGVVTIPKNPRVKGTSMAVAGLVLGLILTIVQGGMIYMSVQVFSRMMTAMTETPDAIFQPVNQGDTAAFRNAFHGNATNASDTEVRQFMDEVTARYGRFVSGRINETAQANQPASQQPVVPIEYVLEFDGPDGRIEVDATVELILYDQVTGALPFKPESIVIYDADLGNLEFPAPATRTGPRRDSAPPDSAAPDDTGDGSDAPR